MIKLWKTLASLVFVMLGIPGMLFALLVLTVKEPPRTGTANIAQPSLADALHEIKLRWQSVAGISLAFACQAGAKRARKRHQSPTASAG